MQYEYDMCLAKTKIICHGARATRIGERLLRHVRKYLKESDFVKGNISDIERKDMLDSISLESLIIYPDDIEKMDTECDIIFQIALDESADNISYVSKMCKNIPCVALIVGEPIASIEDISYISVDEDEITDTFLDLFSIYSFPQEYGASFEELRTLFECGGRILREKSEGFNLCVIRKEDRHDELYEKIRGLENERGTHVLVSRIGKEEKIKYYGCKRALD